MEINKTYKDWIGVYENVFPKDYCNHLINIFEKDIESHRERPIINNDNIYQDISSNPFLKLDENSKNFFYKNIEKTINDYINKYRHLSIITSFGYDINDFKVQKTKPGEGYHAWHHEFEPSISTNVFARWGVWTVYLNDVKKGGETEFLYQSLRVKPKVGTVCLFPAHYTHAHRGNPPLSEEKYIVTGWLNYTKEYIENVSKSIKGTIKDIEETHNKIL